MNFQKGIAETDKIKEKYVGDAAYIEIEGIDGFSVAKTFDCGQCFRFEPVKDSKHEEEFSGVAFGRFISVALDGDRLTVYNCDRKFYLEKLHTFLGLHMSYADIRQDIAARCPTEYMLGAIDCGDGIRILRQDKWEALCSFIISQNNNIPRIKKIIRSLSEKCGEPVSTKGMEAHGASALEFAFPSPERVLALGIDGLKELKVGFRASYIYDAAEKVSSGMIDLDKTASLGTEECIAELCRIKGVGLKVASCTALFSMEKYDSFPIDVWIRRVLDEKFPEGFSHLTLGEFAGIAQQYMFYTVRESSS